MTTTSTTRDFPDTHALNFKNTLQQNPYEWNFPSRKDSMYLSTIANKDVGFNNYSVERNSRSLYTQDIVPTKTRIIKNESYSLKNDDINGSHCKKLAQPLNKPYFYLRNDDVEGSRPFVTKFVTNRPTTNPLNPQYVLPTFEIIEPLQTRFIRDATNIDDIAGARPKELHKNLDIHRKTNFIEDIDGTRAKKDYIRSNILNPLDCKDINEFRIFRTSRVTNPLTPTYKVHDEDNNHIHIGHVEGSKSRVRHPEKVNKEISFSIRTNDIDGCKTSSVGNPYIKNRLHHTQTSTNVTSDIPGAQISTLKKGIQTKRQLNPLDPQYAYLDNEKAVVAKDNELMAAIKDEGAQKGGASKPPTPPKGETAGPKWDLPESEKNVERRPSEKLQPSTNPKL